MTEELMGVITPLLVGVLLIVIGAVNMTGNISSLHSYHRTNVTEENRKPFGKRVGLGNIIIGIGVVALSGAMYLTQRFENDVFTFIGMAIMAVTLVIGLAISFTAMKKYNGGIFRF